MAGGEGEKGRETAQNPLHSDQGLRSLFPWWRILGTYIESYWAISAFISYFWPEVATSHHVGESGGARLSDSRECLNGERLGDPSFGSMAFSDLYQGRMLVRYFQAFQLMSWYLTTCVVSIYCIRCWLGWNCNMEVEWLAQGQAGKEAQTQDTSLLDS